MLEGSTDIYWSLQRFSGEPWPQGTGCIFKGSLVRCPLHKNSSRSIPIAYETSAVGFWPDLQKQAWISLGGLGLKSSKKVVVTSITFMPLLHQWACLTRVVVIVVCRVQRWTILLMKVPYFSPAPDSTFQHDGSWPARRMLPGKY